MDEFFEKKARACRAVLILILLLSVFNFVSSFRPLEEIFRDEKAKGFSWTSLADIDAAAKRIEGEINNPIGKNVFLEGFGYLQLLMGKHEQSNFETVKDLDGALHSTRFASGLVDTSALAENVTAFKASIADKNVQFLYLLTPDKYIRGMTKFPSGMPYGFENETADGFLRLLQSAKIDTVDLRESILNSGIPYDQLFYKTDSHWKIETGFWAFTELVGIFNSRYGMNLDSNGFYTNIENYNFVSYPDSYVGDLGTKTGKYYSGTDDFTIVYPKFKTNLEVSTGSGTAYENQISGLFEDVLISAVILRQTANPYDIETEKYFSYLPNNHGVAHIRNTENPEAPKLAVIKDSMLNPVISFLSLVCSDIYVIDPAYYHGDISSFVNGPELDFVIMSSSPTTLVAAK